MSLSSDEQQALLWPIQAKGAVNRIGPAGDPTIQSVYQQSMEQGRFLESSIADANNWLFQKKQLLTNYIQSYTHMNSLAVDGQLGHTPRVPKYIADSISILQTAQQLQQEITGLVNAIQQNINLMASIEASMLVMIQANANSLANLLNNICNWGLPTLPSIPNLFPSGIWNWNGFEFSPLALFAAIKSNINFNFNFTFANCSLGPTAPLSTFNGNPLQITTDSGLMLGTASYIPPLNGQPVPPGQSLTDPLFIATMQGTMNTAVYGPQFNPNTSMFGAVPDPHTIISDYQMPAATYVEDIVSICPQLRSNTVFLTDSDYSNPNLAVRQPELRKSLVEFVNLADIVASNYDPFVFSAWLIYLNIARQGRGGQWLPNFQAVYNTYIQPSVQAIINLSVPWNDVLPSLANFLWMGPWNSVTNYVTGDVVVFNSVTYVATQVNANAEPDTNPTVWATPLPPDVVYSDAPVIPLAQTFASLSQNQLFHLFWQLSYVEASLLGYTRNGTWDAYQDPSYITGPTGANLDYVPTAITTTQVSVILGETTAEFPVPISFPAVMKVNMNAVIAIATNNIANDPTYLSPLLGNRYTYNQFAQATQVDRYSQFWRDFATNLTAFLAQDPYLVQFAITYPEILDGVLDPLASATDKAAYQSLLQDVATRSRTWTPGTPLLNIPIEPLVSFQNSSTPNVNTNGWIDSADLNPAAFLARPDIQALPIPTQIAMLRTNLSYAGLNKFKNQFQSTVGGQMALAQSFLQTSTQVGFQVEAATNVITATSIASNVLMVIANNAYLPGDLVFLDDTAESFLNGQTVTVLAASATQFTANFTHANYSNPSDTGEAGLVTDVPSGSGGIAVNFDTIDFDMTGNVTTLRPGLFTIQAAGTYNGIATVNFNVTNATGDTVTINVMQNAAVIATASSTVTSPGQVVVSATFVQPFNTDDLVQVFAYASNAAEQTIYGSVFSMVEGSGGGSTPTNMDDETRTYTMDVPFWLTSPIPFLTIVEIDAAGNATPIDPTVPEITSVSITSNVLTITAANHFSVGDLLTFSGLENATFLDGVVVTVATLIGSSPNFTGFTANYTHANYTEPGSPPESGSVLYAIDSSGAVLAPNPDGITLTAASNDGQVTVGVLYGGQYQVAGTGTFTPGALVYAGPGGVITQDYTTLITEVGWIICVGRVTAFDVGTSTVTLIYEPHLATRFSSMI